MTRTDEQLTEFGDKVVDLIRSDIEEEDNLHVGFAVYTKDEIPWYHFHFCPVDKKTKLEVDIGVPKRGNNNPGGFMIQQKQAKMKHKVGSVVYFTENSGRLGLILSVKEHWRSGGRNNHLYTVKYIDVTTGLGMKCPDSRCKTDCVICSHNCWEEDIKPLNDYDLAFYIKEGMVAKELWTKEPKKFEGLIEKIKTDLGEK